MDLFAPTSGDDILSMHSPLRIFRTGKKQILVRKNGLPARLFIFAARIAEQVLAMCTSAGASFDAVQKEKCQEAQDLEAH
mmetsp:Transcript_21093/g.37770  ORF Transcript_21093/g.37770 Transcript_21093/m.37770 type:complete len:80 (+) Transcript_21093:5778-6017(+)